MNNRGNQFRVELRVGTTIIIGLHHKLLYQVKHVCFQKSPLMHVCSSIVNLVELLSTLYLL